jgi:hypothetical protein
MLNNIKLSKVSNNGVAHVKANKSISTTELFEIIQSLSVLDNDKEINLTPIAKAFGKRIDTWKRNSADILQEIRITQNADSDVIRIKQGFDGNQGTFTNNPDVFLEFLRYCSPKIAIKMTRIVSELFQTGKVELKPVKSLSTEEILEMALAEIKASKLALKTEQIAHIQTKEVLEHKNKVVLEHIEDIPAKTLRNKINEIIRWTTYADFPARWKRLYHEFLYRYGINLKERSDNRKLKPLDYCEKEGLLSKLYKLALEVFEVNYNSNQLVLA